MNYTISNKTAQSILDLRNGTYKAFSTDTPEKFNEALRARFNELLPAPNAMGRYNRRQMLKALPQVFEIMEEVLNVTINDAWKTDPFYREFVDSRNLALGDKNDFIVEPDNWVSVNEFAGNHWGSSREKLTGRKKITLDTKWFVSHVFDDFERFKTGAITMESLLAKVTEAFVRHVDTMIAVAFNDAADNLPAAFNFAGTLTTLDMRELLAKVKTASRKNVRIMGTEMAVSQLNELGEVKYSETMKNEVYSTGKLGKWFGNTVIEVPQAFSPGTTDWVVDNDSLLIVPESEKFIKFVDEGETRSRELTETDTDDQTLDWEVQRKMGCAAIFGSAFGKYEIQ